MTKQSLRAYSNVSLEQGFRAKILGNKIKKNSNHTNTLSYNSSIISEQNYIRLTFFTPSEQLTKAVSYDTCILLPICIQNTSVFQYNKRYGKNPYFYARLIIHYIIYFPYISFLISFFSQFLHRKMQPMSQFLQKLSWCKGSTC